MKNLGKLFKYLCLGFLLNLVPINTNALEVALSGEFKDTGGQKFGVVDMQKIYQLYPQTLNAKDDYLKKLDEKKSFLSKKQQELDKIRNQIAVLETTFKSLSPADVVASSGSASVPKVSTDTLSNKSLPELKSDLETKQTEYAEARKLAEDDLKAFEKQQSQFILGNLYKSLKELADEEQVAIVVDKSSVLYGSSAIDLTDKLLNKVRGY
jgi:Skp family chaperone for outer membrane proteins